MQHLLQKLYNRIITSQHEYACVVLQFFSHVSSNGHEPTAGVITGLCVGAYSTWYIDLV